MGFPQYRYTAGRTQDCRTDTPGTVPAAGEALESELEEA